MDQQLFHQMSELEETHWWFVGRRSILNRIISKLPLPPKAEILEAGCGTGGNLPMLSHYGEVYAMEFDETALAFAHQRGIGHVTWGSLPDDIPYGDKSFDLIVLLDVLEHLERDAATLSAIMTRLKPTGFLLITVPAFKFLWSQHDDVHHHFRRYTRSKLKQLLVTANFHINFASYFNSFLFPCVAGIRLARKICRTEHVDDLGTPSKCMNQLLAGLFGAERFFLDWIPLPFGVSLLAVCNKSEMQLLRKNER